jgi:hypothetical protein
MLSKDGLFIRCVMPPFAPMKIVEATIRSRILNYFHNNAKNHILKLLNRYFDLYVCWTTLKNCYKNDSGPRCTYFIDKFFNFRKIESVSMDAYFT